MKPQQQTQRFAQSRVQLMYGLIVFALVVSLVRVFYVQVIRHNYYKAAAQSDQYKEYEIAASRGAIKAYDGDRIVPIVLSHKLYTVYADPELIKDVPKAARVVSDVLGGDERTYEDMMRRDTRYVVLAKKIEESDKNALLKKKLPGVGAQAQEYRTYPQGALAAQLLGFVDDSGEGRYGIEQALNDQLKGKPGLLRAVTDINGVPLAASGDNVRQAPIAGHDVVLTLDIGMQKQAERILQEGVEHAKAESGSVIITEARTGAVKAMANFPSYDPADYTQVEDGSLFNNMAVSDALEVGSIMKPLTAAAALDLGVIQPHSTFYDERRMKIDGATVRNVEEDGGEGTKEIKDILNLSLNTGATWLLMQMGGGELNLKARDTWYGYMKDHYGFGKPTGIEQGYEASGMLPSTTEGYGRNLTYANTSFGQAMTATLIQMSGAFGAVLNGGTYYQPYLVAATEAENGDLQVKKPTVVRKDVVAPGVTKQLQPMMEYTVDNHYFERRFDDAYSVGGKTGTAQIADPNGGYLANDYNGTYAGFVGGDQAEYIITVRINKPKIYGYAGSQAAQPVFGHLAHMLIDNFNVTTKTR